MPGILKKALLIAPLLSLATVSPAQTLEPAPTTSTAIQTLVQEFGPHMLASRYMEKNCKPIQWPGYEGLPTLQCEYTVTDKATSTSKTAPIVLLDAPPEMVATWIVNACTEVSGTLVLDNARRLFKHIISQSGAQFPIAGVVYEDMEGDGYMKAYCFRDGVTVRVEGVEHRTTAPLNNAEREASLHGNVTRVYTYARIASTSPADYTAAGGTIDVGNNQDRKPAWLDVVRQAYIKAWKTGRNELIVDWAKSRKN
jgi:hypothetical protein